MVPPAGVVVVSLTPVTNVVSLPPDEGVVELLSMHGRAVGGSVGGGVVVVVVVVVGSHLQFSSFQISAQFNLKASRFKQNSQSQFVAGKNYLKKFISIFVRPTRPSPWTSFTRTVSTCFWSFQTKLAFTIDSIPCIISSL